jgi:glycosyltransferase involved in cell wall biosynthesis
MPVHNALPFVERSVRYILEHLRDPLVLVDDCSQEETAVWLRKICDQHPGRLHYVRNNQQQLFTRTVNRGLRFVFRHWAVELPRYIAVVNSDCDFQPGWLGALKELMEDPTVGLAGYRDQPPEPAWPAPGSEQFEETAPPGFVTGHCILLRTELISQLGVFCETDLTGEHFPEFAPYHGLAHIGSDRLMSYTLHEAGYRTLYSNYDGVRHAAGRSWNHDLGWLHTFNLQLLWEPKDTI